MRNKEFVYKYWSRTEFGRKMIASNRVSDSDLLFLIPNNVKRRHGLPITRIPGKKKRQQKKQKRKHILSFNLFDIIEETVENVLSSKFSQNEFFGQFVEIKDLSIGDRNIWKIN